jgi:hypothetical protein
LFVDFPVSIFVVIDENRAGLRCHTFLAGCAIFAASTIPSAGLFVLVFALAFGFRILFLCFLVARHGREKESRWRKFRF